MHHFFLSAWSIFIAEADKESGFIVVLRLLLALLFLFHTGGREVQG
jgi:hypothetical protein